MSKEKKIYVEIIYELKPLISLTNILIVFNYKKIYDSFPIGRRRKITKTTMENRGLPLRSIISHSLWITLVGILLFSLSTTKKHNFGYTKFFSICGTLLMTIPWIIQLLLTSAVILLHKSIGYNLMWVVRPPKSSKENHHPTNVVTISSSSPSSPLSSGQALKNGDAGEIEIRIVIPRSPNSTHLEIEGRNNSKLLANGSPVS